MDTNDELAAAMAAYNDAAARADEGQERLARARAALRDLAQAAGLSDLPEKHTLVTVIFPWRPGLRPGQIGRVLWAERPGGVALVGVTLAEGRIDICPPWCLRRATGAEVAAALNRQLAAAPVGEVAGEHE